jgi:pimeloyl-ACP methyl ester carboxylesterase
MKRPTEALDPQLSGNDRLAPSGLNTQTIDLPSVAAEGQPRFGMHDDAEVVRGLLSRTEWPLIVVAHSYGAIPVTQVVHELPNVLHVVYVAAFQLDVGETLLGAAGGEIPSWWIVNEDIVNADRAADIFYNDVEPRAAAWAQSRLLPSSFAAFTEPLTAAAWRNIASTYIICERDQAVPLHAQEVMAQRAESMQRISTGHSPMLSQPSELAEIINGVATQY